MSAMWTDPRPGKRCRNCRIFAELQSANCAKDTYQRPKIYALDYTCGAFEEAPR